MESNFFLTAENWLFYITLVLYAVSMVLYILFIAVKKENICNTAIKITYAGFLLHTLAIVSRGIGAGRAPFSNQYEFSSSFAWGIVLCFIIFERRFKFKTLGIFIMPIAILIIGYAAMLSKDVHQLMPALQSTWLVIHVSVAIISYGSFAVACGTSLVEIFRPKMKSEFAAQYIPDEEKLDTISYRVIALGFVSLTLCIITGAIWGKRALGHYWQWDPKETWSLITWIVYSIYLHQRSRRKMKGKKAAIYAVVGFVCVIFTYFGVNLLLPGLHSYVL